MFDHYPFLSPFVSEGTDNYILDIKDIILTPEQPVPGKELMIQAVGYLKEPVKFGATAHVLVKLGVVQIMSQNVDICQELEKNEAKLECPINEGLVKIIQRVTLPKEIPKARFKVEVRAKNYDGLPLACLDIAINFRHHSPTVKNRLLAEW
ncbi:hypothetical protein BX666DRAFT_2148901 [Dichotomocladium elegans]|nr:hypothetical protein BX666DRAFT_2148901 [Dichotomocladium elegans]